MLDHARCAAQPCLPRVPASTQDQACALPAKAKAPHSLDGVGQTMFELRLARSTVSRVYLQGSSNWRAFLCTIALAVAHWALAGLPLYGSILSRAHRPNDNRAINIWRSERSSRVVFHSVVIKDLLEACVVFAMGLTFVIAFRWKKHWARIG
jgi:hypothetical protein